MGPRGPTAERLDSYDSDYARSLRDPEGFWAEAAADLRWTRRWREVLDRSRAPAFRWFVGGELNTCDNALDLHVDEGRGDQPALIHDSPVTGTQQSLTYRQLRDQTARFAGALAAHGVRKGDRVVIYMPMVPEAVIAMLACARLGAIHCVVSGGFAAAELADRIDDCRPRVVVAASCGIEPGHIVRLKPLLDQAIALAAHQPEFCIILQRATSTCALVPGRDVTWANAIADAEPHPCVTCKATDPLYILYTSGTTGRPKGVVRDHGGHAVAVKWSMRHVYDVGPGEVFWAASDLGWVLGHSNIVYGPLLNGSTTILFEGRATEPPEAGAFWRAIQDHRVKSLFTATGTLRNIRRADPEGEQIQSHDLSSLRSLFLAGERVNADTVRWAELQFGVPVVDHWWQTESGWPMGASCLGLGRMPVKHGSSGRPVPGWNLHVLDTDGREMPVGRIGALVVKLPLPPGSLPGLWDDEKKFQDSYLARFPGYYETSDAGFIDDEGYVFVMARTDDIIQVAGHRFSTGCMEEVMAGHPDVAECAVVGIADSLKGQVPLGLAVLEYGVRRDPEAIVAELVQRLRTRVGPVASFKQALIVPGLPKTRSGMILRGTVRRIADGKRWRMPSTIEDPGVLVEVARRLHDEGYPRPGGQRSRT